MNVRRVQKTGGSSYFVTLPKEWAVSQNIKKNDPIGIFIQSNGKLLITPQIIGEEAQKIKKIDITDITEEKYLLRLLIGAYIAGFDNIEIISKKRMEPFVRMVTRKYTGATIGQEVVEETDKTILVKDLLDPAEMPFERTIKRMHIIVKGMLEDSIRALQRSDKRLSEDIMLRDNDVDRLHWLVARQNNIILRNVSLAEKMNITIRKSSTCFLISRIIERIGDHVVQISRNSQKLISSKLQEDSIIKIQEAGNLALNVFSGSISSFFKRDIVSSNKNIDSVRELQVLCEGINTMALQQKGDLAISLGYIAESLRRIGEYAEDISETVINYLIDEER